LKAANSSRVQLHRLPAAENFYLGPQFTEIRVLGRPAQKIATPADPLSLIDRRCATTADRVAGIAAFHGGAVGFVGYEYVTRIERAFRPRRRMSSALRCFISCYPTRC